MIQDSPVPAQTVFGSDGAMASVPMACTSCLSKTGSNDWPPSEDFHTPPEDDPRYQMLGSPGTPTTAAIRPAGAGPMYLNFKVLSTGTTWGTAAPPPRP